MSFSRLAAIGDTTATDDGDLIVEASFASEVPYERWWGVEILDCAPESVRLDRLNDGAPVLFNHDWSDLRGVHVAGSVRLDADRVARAQFRLTAATQAGRDAIGLVRSGVLTKTSVGYEIHSVVETVASKSGEPVSRTLSGALFDRVLTRSHQQHPGDIAAFQRALDAAAGPFERAAGETPVYRVIDWEPMENSLVTVPADHTVGVGRSADLSPPAPASEPAHTTPPTIETERTTMTTETLQPVDEAAIEQRGAAAANKRISDLIELGNQYRSFDGVDALIRDAMASGASVHAATRSVLDHIAEHNTFKPEIGMSQQEAKRFSVVRAVRAMLNKDWSGAGFEREASKAFADKALAAGIQRQADDSFFLPYEVQRRDMTVGTAANGGNMVATELRPQDFIELLRSRNLMMQLGARMLTGLVGNADITKQTASSTGYWLASESTAPTESNPTVGLLQLRPKVVGAYTEVSRLLLQQSTPDADMFIMDDLAKVLATTIDVAAFSGDGTGGAPTGVLNTSGIGAFTGTTLGLSGLMDAQVDVATANALTAGCAYVTTPAVAALLAQRARIASTDSITLWKGNILDGNIEGFRAASSTNIPVATMIFGDFSQVIMAEWGALEIAANPYANFAAGITGIRAFHTVDVGVRIAGAFSAASSIT